MKCEFCNVINYILTIVSECDSIDILFEEWNNFRSWDLWKYKAISIYFWCNSCKTLKNLTWEKDRVFVK